MSGITFACIVVIVFAVSVVKCTPGTASPKLILEKHCNSLKTCRDCKSAKFPCEWCHNFGCTASPHHYCPKVVLESMQAKQVHPTCPKIDAGSTVFIAANIRNIIKVNLTTNDWDVEKNRLICSLDVNYKTVQGVGTVHGRTIYCDMAEIKMKRDVMVGKLKVIWGGADPYSNSVLVVVYRCEGLANNCGDCKKVHDEFECGWCEESSSCTVIQNCPRQIGKWSPKTSNCFGENTRMFVEAGHTHVKPKANEVFKTF